MKATLRRAVGSVGLILALLLVITMATTPPSHAQSCVYIVQSGDTLGAIAAANDTTVSTLLDLNPGITNVNLIYPGQVLLLPGCPTSGASGNSSGTDLDEGNSGFELVAVPSKPADLSRARWQRVHDATFNIRYPVGAPYVGGSGVMIGLDGRTFVTAYHVIDDWSTENPRDYVPTVEIGPFAQWRYTANVLEVDPGVDLAVLQVNEAEFPGFAVAPVGQSRRLAFGDPIYTLSYPLEGTQLITSKGSYLETFYDPYYDTPIIVTDAEANFGSSGGVALNSDGQVIGIISAGIFGREYVENFGYSGADTLTIIVPVEAAYPMFWSNGVGINRQSAALAQE